MQAIILSSNTAIRARVITVRTSAREIDGISKAVLVEQLKEKLKSGKIIKFAYLKSNGEVRVAFGTTNPDFIKIRFVDGDRAERILRQRLILIWKNVLGVPSDGKT